MTAPTSGTLTIRGDRLATGDRLTIDGRPCTVVAVRRDPGAVVVQYQTRDDDGRRLENRAAGIHAMLPALPGLGDPDPIGTIGLVLYVTAPDLGAETRGLGLEIRTADGFSIGWIRPAGPSGIHLTRGRDAAAEEIPTRYLRIPADGITLETLEEDPLGILLPLMRAEEDLARAMHDQQNP